MINIIVGMVSMTIILSLFAYMAFKIPMIMAQIVVLCCTANWLDIRYGRGGKLKWE